MKGLGGTAYFRFLNAPLFFEQAPKAAPNRLLDGFAIAIGEAVSLIVHDGW